MSSKTIRKPAAFAFDVNETLFDLSVLRDTFSQFGLPDHSLSWWFAALLRDGMALAASGDAAPFGMIGAAALEEIYSSLGRPAPTDAVSVVLETFAKLPAHKDVMPAFKRLRAAGVPAIALTNGNANVTRGLLERANLSDLLDMVLSVDDVAHWKPRPEPYRYAAEKIGVAVASLAMVAVHPWDTHGAKRAGLISAWVNRNGRGFPKFFAAPDIEAPSVEEAVARLLEAR